MKTFLLSGQENALSLISRAVATVLNDRPELFTEDNTIDVDDADGNDIYAAPLPAYINLNGEFSDWGEQLSQAINFTADVSELPNQDASELATEPSISVDHVLGYRGNFIYAMFKVYDNSVVLRQRGFLRVDTADHIRLSLQTPDRPEQRYTLIARETGRMSMLSLIHI